MWTEFTSSSHGSSKTQKEPTCLSDESLLYIFNAIISAPLETISMYQVEDYENIEKLFRIVNNKQGVLNYAFLKLYVVVKDPKRVIGVQDLVTLYLNVKSNTVADKLSQFIVLLYSRTNASPDRKEFYAQFLSFCIETISSSSSSSSTRNAGNESLIQRTLVILSNFLLNITKSHAINVDNPNKDSMKVIISHKYHKTSIGPLSLSLSSSSSSSSSSTPPPPPPQPQPQPPSSSTSLSSPSVPICYLFRHPVCYGSIRAKIAADFNLPTTNHVQISLLKSNEIISIKDDKNFPSPAPNGKSQTLTIYIYIYIYIL